MLLDRAVRLHSAANLGETPVLESILTRIFLFACQFCKGNHGAAKFRLREEAALAETMRLGDGKGYYYCGLPRDETDRRLRPVLCLTMVEVSEWFTVFFYPFSWYALLTWRL